MTTLLSPRAFLGAAAAAAMALTMTAQPVDRSEVDALRAQVQRLEQQIKLLTERLEASAKPAPAVADAPAAAPAASAPAPKITATDKALGFASADGANSIKFGGLIQADARVFFDDPDGLVNTAFLLRRARVITQGAFARNFGYQFVTEFGGGSVSILDAAVSVTLSPAAQFKFGKMKVPIGLELLQSDSWTFFNERSIATNLVPNRDVGAQVSGDVLGGKLNYMLGLFNGVADGASSNNSDFDEDKNLVGRLFASPFKGTDSPVKGLSFGVAGSVGKLNTSAGRTSGYRTDGQQVFFTYLGATVADGRAWRIAPQFDYRRGPFGANGEYIVSATTLRPAAGGPARRLENTAWHLSGGYVLTGEASTPNGVTPRKDFDWAAGTWGAFEVTARYSNLKIDNAAFPAFASAASSAKEVDGLGVGLSWYLSKVVRFTFDAYQTRFGFHSLAPAVPTALVLRQDEKALITRFQISF